MSVSDAPESPALAPPSPAAPTETPLASGEWQPLPARACGLFVLSMALPLAAVGGVAGAVLAVATDAVSPLLGAPLLALLGAGLGAWWGRKYFRHTAWRLDAHGLGLRRGRLWHSETRVPASRVQHLDLKRGPLQRRRDLATLVVHTAGTRHSAVSVYNLDAGDAERLRDLLARQIDHDGDA